VPSVPRPLVLYVEDDPTNRDIMQWRLKDRYEIVLAADDREACNTLRRHQDELRCILMDIELQGSILNGIQLASLFTGHPIEDPLPAYAQGLPVSEAPLLFVTAYSDKYDNRSLKSAGGLGVLRKPIDFSELTEMMLEAPRRAYRDGSGA